MRIFVFFISILFLVGCSRQTKTHSAIQLRTPSAKLGIFASLPAGRTVCYGVSVRGPGITTTAASTCKPEIGTTLGFVGDGGVIQGEVLKGQSRIFDVYLYLQGTGETLPCPTMAAGFSSISPDKLYHIGSLENVKLEKDTETIDISTTFPGEAQNLAAVNSYPSSCIPTTTNYQNNYQVSTATNNLTGSGYILQGRVGRANSGTVLTGTGIQLRVKD